MSNLQEYPPQQNRSRISIDELHEAFKKEFDQLSLDEKRERIAKLLASWIELAQEKGGKYYENMNDFFRDLNSNEEVLIRRESPERLFHMLESGEPMEISFDHAEAPVSMERYANAVKWRPIYGRKGLENALYEGWGGLKGLVTVAGIDEDSVNVESIPDNQKFFGDIDRRLVVSVDGEVKPDDLKFIFIRIPARFLPEEMLTEDEEDKLLEEEEKMEKAKQLGKYNNGNYPDKKNPMAVRGIIF